MLTLAAAAINACRQCGARLQQGAANYSRAEADSMLGGGGVVLAGPPEPARIAPPGPPGTWGNGEPPPLLWAVVQSFVDDVWPDGDVEGLRAAAARWKGFGAAAGGMRGAVNASKSLFDGQHIPEGGLIDEGLSKISDSLGRVGELSKAVADQLDEFADDISHAQQAIRDLLNRLGSLTDLGHDLMLIVKGDALDEIKKVGRDVNEVLHQFGREARAMEKSLKAFVQVVDGEVVGLEKYVRGELKNFFGDAVGNQVATVFDTWLNANEGVLKGAVGMVQSLGELDPRWFLLDPKGAASTWSTLGETLWKGSLFNALVNPHEATQTQLQELKALLHLDDWSRARPGLGFGENLLDVASLFVPGGGEAGAAADGAGAAARGAEAAGAAGRAGERAAGEVAGAAGARGALADIAATSSKLTNDLDGVVANLPKIEPSPVGGHPVGLPEGKLPGAPVASAPHAPDAGPGAPHAPDAPHGPASAEPPGPGGAHPAPASPGGPHDPGGGPPAAAPAPAGGPHEPPPGPAAAAPAPASPPGGPPEPGFEAPAASAPASGGPHGFVPTGHAPEPPLPSGGAPHDPGLEPRPAPAPADAPGGGPHDPGSLPGDRVHELASDPAGGPHGPGYEPEPAPAHADAASGGPHDLDSAPGGRSNEPGPEPAGTREPVSVPAGGAHEPASVPPGGPHDPLPAAAPVGAPAAVPASVGDRLPSAVRTAAESAPGRAPVAPGGAPVEPAAAAARSGQPMPSMSAATPHSTLPGGRPTELPPPGRGHGLGTGHGGSAGGPPGGKPPHGGAPRGAGGG
ncbi:hypothetical protein, partial [Mycobacterium palustre]|uniref:WXG100-like domain-containing protein n=1 Tax=Mycobacterium palustre TaxID=153971 RepID=UPI003CCB7776